MKAIIVAIGDELLIGQVVNTNAAFIASRLNDIGIEVIHMTTVADDESEILEALDASFGKADLTVVTGGLGPTHDDITTKTLCTFFHTDLVLNQDVLAHVQLLAAQRNIKLTKAAEGQALVPRSANIVHNRHGTAPGLFFEQNDKFLLAMPGVPYEMEAIVDDFLIPFFRKRKSNTIIVHRTLNTTGIGESILSDHLGNLDEMLMGAKLAFLPSPFGVRLRITAIEKDEASASRKIEEIERRIRTKAEKYIFSTDEESLEEVIAKLLTARQLTLAVAESCTGGLVADRITNVSGSSKYFERGIVTYSNRSKIELLGVPQPLIDAHGAVSKEVAEAMASGVRTIAKTDIGLSTTGVAGPTGGTSEKPIGLVWIGYSDIHASLAVKFNFGADRRRIKERASQAALEILRRRILTLG